MSMDGWGDCGLSSRRTLALGSGGQGGGHMLHSWGPYVKQWGTLCRIVWDYMLSSGTGCSVHMHGRQHLSKAKWVPEAGLVEIWVPFSIIGIFERRAHGTKPKVVGLSLADPQPNCQCCRVCACSRVIRRWHWQDVSPESVQLGLMHDIEGMEVRNILIIHHQIYFGRLCLICRDVCDFDGRWAGLGAMRAIAVDLSSLNPFPL